MLNCSYFLFPLISRNEFIFGSIVVLVLVSCVLWQRAGDRVERFLVGVIVGGAGLNLVERLIFGCVRDQFNFFGIFHFNFWDTAITVGVLTFLIRKSIKKVNA